MSRVAMASRGFPVTRGTRKVPREEKKKEGCSSGIGSSEMQKILDEVSRRLRERRRVSLCSLIPSFKEAMRTGGPLPRRLVKALKKKKKLRIGDGPFDSERMESELREELLRLCGFTQESAFVW